MSNRRRKRPRAHLKQQQRILTTAEAEAAARRVSPELRFSDEARDLLLSTLDRYGHDLVRSSARIFIAENRLRAERGISTGVMRVTGDIVAVAAQETALESGVVPVAGRSPPPPASGSLPPPGGVHPALTGADSDSDGEDDLVQAGSATPGGVRAALLAAPDDAGGGSTAGALPTGRTPPPAPLGSLHDAFLEDVATT